MYVHVKVMNDDPPLRGVSNIRSIVKMPAIVKVQVVAARDLPVMDRSSDSTDCFVEVSIIGHNHYGFDYNNNC